MSRGLPSVSPPVHAARPSPLVVSSAAGYQYRMSFLTRGTEAIDVHA